MEVLAVINQKGGVGKTTTVLNLGPALAAKKQRVLLIDLDPQANLSSCYKTVDNRASLDTSGWLMDPGRASDAIQNVGDNLDLIKASRRLMHDLDDRLRNLSVGGDTRLRKALASLRNQYDWVLLDCPPNLGKITVNALAASSIYLVPMRPEFFSVHAFSALDALAHGVKEELNQYLHFLGILFTQYNRASRTRSHREVVEELSGKYPTFNVTIRQSNPLAVSPSLQQDIFKVSPESAGAYDYQKLADEVLTKIEQA
ncbi:chromosome partitioning protein [Catalinimonas alkaloidigena]|uniref:Chromosome partitioning protein n=1 Tax=Catalinimonas alkaloidigena TaxID=1075417 RepID=A0A1G9VJU6_9BACT|nr:ParA family protein [Catalinimonas alkaloidigena]SDM72464.1 chromosome partitioning protein [Catalinimonas alkaloidigena]